MEKAIAGKSYHPQDKNKGNRVESLKLSTLKMGACRARTQPSKERSLVCLYCYSGWDKSHAEWPCWEHRPPRRGLLFAGVNVFDDGICGFSARVGKFGNWTQLLLLQWSTARGCSWELHTQKKPIGKWQEASLFLLLQTSSTLLQGPPLPKPSRGSDYKAKM